MGEAIRRPPRRGEVTACQTNVRGRRSGQHCQELSISCLHLTAYLLWRSFLTPLYPPGTAAHSAGRAQVLHKFGLEIDQNFDHFLASIFDRFWLVLGRHLGVILGTCDGQVRPRSVQNASCKLINIKNVIFHETHARVHESANLAPKMASKMPQDRPKTAPRGS